MRIARQISFSAVVLAAGLLLASSGCGRSPLNKAPTDQGKKDTAVINDFAGDAPRDGLGDGDMSEGPKDERPFVWPDLKGRTDLWPKPDTYGGPSPFGCHADTDCFHLRCCPTPWGVKLCMERCP